MIEIHNTDFYFSANFLEIKTYHPKKLNFKKY